MMRGAGRERSPGLGTPTGCGRRFSPPLPEMALNLIPLRQCRRGGGLSHSFGPVPADSEASASSSRCRRLAKATIIDLDKRQLLQHIMAATRMLADRIDQNAQQQCILHEPHHRGIQHRNAGIATSKVSQGIDFPGLSRLFPCYNRPMDLNPQGALKRLSLREEDRARCVLKTKEMVDRDLRELGGQHHEA